MNIYFGDLAYLSKNNYTTPLPLNAGYITSYLLKSLPVKVKIFKDPNKLLDTINEKCPDVLALTCYNWNANLNFAIAKKCKKDNPNLVVIMGGPAFVTEDKEWKEQFFLTNPFIDLFIVREGEYSFLKCIELLLENNLNLGKSDRSKWPNTFYGFDHKEKKIIHNPMLPVERLELSTVPSPFLNGLLDEFLHDERLAPIIETNRGCPYNCSFCVWGQATLTKLRKFDLNTVVDEIHYISKETKNPTKVMFVADANFGILKRDSEIADAFMECKEKYDFPKRLFVYSLKNQTIHSINTYEKIKSIANMSMSYQSTNEKTLEEIGRKNIPIQNYETNRALCEQKGIKTYCEMIYGLPDETFDTFTNGISEVLQAGQERIQLYAHSINLGAETATKEYMKKFGFETRFRYQPEYAGTHHGISTTEYEELVVKTNTMSLDDFLKIRDIHFFVLLLGSSVFKEFQRMLKCSEFNIAIISKLLLSEEKLWPTSLKEIMKGFRKACKDELLTKEDIKKEINENDVKRLKTKEMMLVPAAICKLFAKRTNIVDFFDCLSETIKRNLNKNHSEETLKDIILSLSFSCDRAVYYDGLDNNKKLEYSYDIDAWLKSEKPVGLSKYKTSKNIIYDFKLDDGLEEAFVKAKAAATTLEESVYLLKFKFFPLSDDRIFSYTRYRSKI